MPFIRYLLKKSPSMFFCAPVSTFMNFRGVKENLMKEVLPVRYQKAALGLIPNTLTGEVET